MYNLCLTLLSPSVTFPSASVSVSFLCFLILSMSIFCLLPCLSLLNPCYISFSLLCVLHFFLPSVSLSFSISLFSYLSFCCHYLFSSLFLSCLFPFNSFYFSLLLCLFMDLQYLPISLYPISMIASAYFRPGHQRALEQGLRIVPALLPLPS